MTDEISSINPDIEQSENQPDNKFSRRDFGKLAFGAGVALASAATKAAIYQQSDPTFNSHVSTLLEDTARMAATDPEYQPSEYSSLYNEHASFIASTEGEWTDILAPGLDKFFGLYFGKSLAEGLTTMQPIAADMNVDSRNLVLAASFWGGEKIRTEDRVLLEDATNLAQTTIAAELDNNIIDKSLGTINPNLKAIQSIYSSSALDGVIPDYLRKIGSKRVRSVGPNDASAEVNAHAVAAVIENERLGKNYFGNDFSRQAEVVTQLSAELKDERTVGIPSKVTSDNFVSSARNLEAQIVDQQRDLDFGLKLFTANIRYREYLIQRELGIESFDDLDEEQRAIEELILLASLDDYPNSRMAHYNEHIDGQFSKPEDIIPAVANDLKETDYIDMETTLDPSNWDPSVQGKIDFLHRLRDAAAQN